MLAGVTEPTARRPWTVWAVTWLSYATYYFGRKNLSVTKAAIGRALGTHALYGVETAYLAAYAAGQYVSGWLGDRVGARRLVGFGMLAAAGASFAFGLWSAGALFLVTATVNGFAQSTGWPGNVKAMQEWTSVESRGRVMGVWATCYQVGGIAATAFAAWLLGHYGWRAAYFGPAAVLAAVPSAARWRSARRSGGTDAATSSSSSFAIRSSSGSPTTSRRCSSTAQARPVTSRRRSRSAAYAERWRWALSRIACAACRDRSCAPRRSSASRRRSSRTPRSAGRATQRTSP